MRYLETLEGKESGWQSGEHGLDSRGWKDHEWLNLVEVIIILFSDCDCKGWGTEHDLMAEYISGKTQKGGWVMHDNEEWVTESEWGW